MDLLNSAALRVGVLALFGVAVVVNVALGSTAVGVVCLVLGLVATILVLLPRRTESGPPAPVDPAQAGRLRAQRDREDEIAAVRSLRA